jgi:hypothetical protein
MKNKTKHLITTYVIFVVLWTVAIFNTDGYTDSLQDSFLLLYPIGLIWIWLREAGFLRFKK